ncbi:MAG: 16S rRNA (guanine(966)-N(2))-methyltransferase RsmD, partial [Clostridiales bacterium]|nr:16S rRNA (guanine(966)-N(2))-methyltransferase RsmD [Clostridiales bacterium]
MRIISGSARSLKLKSPKGAHTRPTSDRVKETLFNIIAHDIYGRLVLDLYSGSGALGIEAISRGAEYAYFVDNSAEATACIKDNLRNAKMTDRGCVLKRDVPAALRYLEGLPELTGRCFDLIFIDPPYGMEYEKQVLFLLGKKKYLGAESLIVLEAQIYLDAALILPEG